MKPPTATLRSVAERAPIGYVVVACFLSFACYNLVPGSGTAADFARTAAGALCAVALLAVGDPAALRPRSGQSVVRLCVWLVAVACAVGAGSLLASGVFDVAAPIAPGAAAGAGAGPSLSPGVGGQGSAAAAAVAGQLVPFVSLCLVTGLFEEALFRGVMFRGFACAFEASGRANPLLWAAAVSAGVFGVLHVSGGPPAVPPDAVVLAQAVLKPVQAALFGFVMAGVFARSHNLWLACGLHAAFNALSEGPLFLASGYLPATYLTGSVADAVLLAVGSALLVPAAVKARTWLAGACIL